MKSVQQQKQDISEVLQMLGLESVQARRIFLERFPSVFYEKDKTIFHSGKQNASEYFLLNGILQRFNLNEKGEEITTGFYQDLAVVTPHFARTIHGKSIFSLRSLTPVEIIVMPVKEFDQLRMNDEEFMQFGQRVIEGELIKTVSTEIAFRSSTAKERLLHLRKVYPNIENLIPHTVIASYLGITQVSFSRLRNQLAKD